MLPFEIERGSISISRSSALLDTNVLIALADDRDNDHEQALAVLEVEETYTWIVVPPVIVESVGLLVRRTKSYGPAVSLLYWMLDPGNRVVVMPDPNHPFEIADILDKHAKWMTRYSVDYVDAYIMQAADRITRACNLRPEIPVFTFDTGDYLKCSRQGYRFSLYDMRTADGVLEFR